MLSLQWIIFTGSPISWSGGMVVLAVTLKHTLADMQVTSLPPLWQSFTKMLILLGSNLTVVCILMTLRDLRGESITERPPWGCFIYLFFFLVKIPTKEEQQHRGNLLPGPPIRHCSCPSCRGCCVQSTAGLEPNLQQLFSEERMEEETENKWGKPRIHQKGTANRCWLGLFLLHF